MNSQNRNFVDICKIRASLNFGYRDLSERRFYLGDLWPVVGDRGIRFVSGGVVISGLVGIFILKRITDAQSDA